MKQDARFFAVALTIFIVDQVTKLFIKAYVGPYDVIPVLPFFNIVYAENTGSAFGLFKGLGSSFFIIVAVIAMVAVYVLMRMDRGHAFMYALILGGAAGNLADRVMYGYVVDFLDFYVDIYHWPAFNVADSSLTIGIICMLYVSLFTKETGRQ